MQPLHDGPGEKQFGGEGVDPPLRLARGRIVARGLVGIPTSVRRLLPPSVACGRERAPASQYSGTSWALAAPRC